MAAMVRVGGGAWARPRLHPLLLLRSFRLAFGPSVGLYNVMSMQEQAAADQPPSFQEVDEKWLRVEVDGVEFPAIVSPENPDEHIMCSRGDAMAVEPEDQSDLPAEPVVR